VYPTLTRRSGIDSAFDCRNPHQRYTQHCFAAITWCVAMVCGTPIALDYNHHTMKTPLDLETGSAEAQTRRSSLPHWHSLDLTALGLALMLAALVAAHFYLGAWSGTVTPLAILDRGYDLALTAAFIIACLGVGWFVLRLLQWTARDVYEEL